MGGLGWPYGVKSIRGKNERVFYRAPVYGAEMMDEPANDIEAY
jgi:hypothetical protein